MKKFIILINLIFLMSCGGILNTELHEVTFEIVDNKNISDSEKENIVTIITKRLNVFSRYVDVRIKDDDKITIRLSKGYNIDFLNMIVKNKGKLDFWNCIDGQEVIQFLKDTDEILANDKMKNPILSMAKGMSAENFLTFNVKDTLKLNKLLNNDKIKNLHLEDKRQLKFLYSKPTDNQVILYAYKSNKTGRAKITEKNITEARQGYDQINRPTINIEMDAKGANNWIEMTKLAFETRGHIAIAINDVVFSAPMVSNGPIEGGRSQISGQMTLTEAQNLSAVLNGKGIIPKLKFISNKKLESK